LVASLVGEVATSAGLPSNAARELIAASYETQVKARLTDNTKDAVNAGCYGVPVMYYKSFIIIPTRVQNCKFIGTDSMKISSFYTMTKTRIASTYFLGVKLTHILAMLVLDLCHNTDSHKNELVAGL
jgi:hypothetical protein